MLDLDDIEGLRVSDLRLRDGEVFGTVTVERDLPFFQGHFPGFPILPAAAQLEIVNAMVGRALGGDASIVSVDRVKFGSKVDPGSRLQLKARYVSETGMLDFTLDNGPKPAASGRLRLLVTR